MTSRHGLRVSRLLWTLALTAYLGSLGVAQGTRPNIILILADDLGYGDLGCYGSRRNRTPHIDRLAAQGLRFTDFHSNGPMCTPTRAALLTGRYQQRLGPMFDTPLSGKTQRDQGLPLSARTLPEALKEKGYATGMFGKWHLGYQLPFLPTRQGFDRFRGLASGDGDHHTHIDRVGFEDWWHNEHLEMETGYTADLLTQHSVRFMEENRERPFFLFLSHLAIHFPWQGPEDPPHRVKGTDYWEDKWGLIPDPNDIRPHVKAMVESIDAGVGRLMETLKRLQLERDTLVLFTSDNGGYIHYGKTHRNISSNGPLRGQKSQVFEGGHRVPAIAWWPGKIEPGVSAETAMTFDLFPTMLRLAGASSAEIGTRFDGVDLSPLLFEGAVLPERTLFWRIRSRHAVRRGVWKLVSGEEEEPMLFRLDRDLGEERDVARQYPEVVRRLSGLYQGWLDTLPGLDGTSQ